MVQGNIDSVRVSICCITYNHAAYIAEAMEGFLSQETDFDFEILVHDDASTDGTTEILDEYERLYPGIVRVFRESENQFGKNKYKGGYLGGLLVPEARGEYIALCEGDDYWVSDDKLQSQVDYLDSHPGCSMTCHAAQIIDGRTKDSLGVMGMGKKSRELSVPDFCEHWNISTASKMMRKCYYPEYADKWSFKKPVGDFPMAVYYATKGPVYYDSKVRSIYRYLVPGSWTSSQGICGEKLRTAHAWLGMLESMDELTNRAWHGDLVLAGKASVHVIGTQQGLSYVGTSFGKEVLRSLSPKERIAIFAKRVLWRLGYVSSRENGKVVLRNC